MMKVFREKMTFPWIWKPYTQYVLDDLNFLNISIEN
jgi:hypothetical protein